MHSTTTNAFQGIVSGKYVYWIYFVGKTLLKEWDVSKDGYWMRAW